MCKLTEDVERKSREYVSRLKTLAELAVINDKYAITCDGCCNPIFVGKEYLCRTIKDRKDSIIFAYCEECMHEMLSDEDIEALHSHNGKKKLSDNPSELCEQCIKFLDDGHYDNSDEIKPLYEMLNKLKSLLKDKQYGIY